MIWRGAFKNPTLNVEGERGESLRQARSRLVLLGAFFAVLYLLVAARAFDLSVVQGHFGQLRENIIASRSGDGAASRRGDVYDRGGVLVATTLKTASLYADATLITQPEKTAKGLYDIFQSEPYGGLLQKLQSGKKFVWLKRNLTPDEQYAILKLGEVGLQFQSENRRIYPQGKLLSHMLGFTNVDNKGIAGIERGFDKHLAGGNDLKLSLDTRMQHALRREILKTMETFTAKAGAGVVLDVATGEVLAGVSLPDFDPHHAGKAAQSELFNRLTLGVYELGSMFKIFSTAALLDLHDLPMNTKFDARESLKRGRFTIKDFHAENRQLTIPEVFMYSSNIGSALMGEMIGTDALQSFYYDLGLLDRLKLEISETGRPIVPVPWRDINTLTAAYGHGVTTSPLQLTSAVASIVNGGVLVKPTLIAAKEEGDQPSDKTKNELRIVSEKTAHRMRQLMRLVVTDGTGSKAKVAGYRVGGKTGTAEKISGRGYDRDRLISSFVGAFPMEAPKYAVMIMVDEPKGHKGSFGYATGGWVAAPAVANVISSIAAITGMVPRHKKDGEDFGAGLAKYVHLKTKEKENFAAR